MLKSSRLQISLLTNLLFVFFLAGFQSSAQTKILFVGNSLTYSNDLPQLVQRLGKDDGVKIVTEMIAFPNYALEDHWNESNVSGALRKTKFDFVIFQQGPSAMPASRTNFIEYSLKFSELCRANNTKMCMFTVWPSGDRSFDFPNVVKSYAIAADTIGGTVLQAGLAWQKILNEKKDFPVYSADGFHPSIHGSFLSAMVIYATLFRKKNLDFLTVKNTPSKYITEANLALMKRVTLDVIAR